MKHTHAVSIAVTSLVFLLGGIVAPASASVDGLKAASQSDDQVKLQKQVPDDAVATRGTSDDEPTETGEATAKEPYVDPETGELVLGDEDKGELDYGISPFRVEPYKLGKVKTAGKCKFQHGGDEPHTTSGEVSAHGWWVISGGSNCPDKAKVRNKLQAYACMGKRVCGWVTQKTGSKYSVYAGSGSGKRSNARTACRSSKLVGWRNLVDVDLEWRVDPAGWDELGRRNLGCSPAK